MKIEITLEEKDGKASVAVNGKEPFEIDITGVNAAKTKAWIVYIKIYNALEAALREAFGEKPRAAPNVAKAGKSKLNLDKFRAAPRPVDP